MDLENEIADFASTYSLHRIMARFYFSPNALHPKREYDGSFCAKVLTTATDIGKERGMYVIRTAECFDARCDICTGCQRALGWTVFDDTL